MARRKPATADRPSRKPLRLVTIPFAQLDDPLAYLLADHARQRAVCAALQDFAATGRASRDEADQVISFLVQDRVIHHADEDLDLFPAVSRRLLPEDNLGAVLARLREDHRRSDILADAVVAVLSAHPNRKVVRIDATAREALQFYAADEQRHLAIENGVVLAIAAIRLTRRDLRLMSSHMKARRGVAV